MNEHPYETWKDVRTVSKALWALDLSSHECDKFEKHRCYEIELKGGVEQWPPRPRTCLSWNLRTGRVTDYYDGTVVVELLTVDNAEAVARYLRGA